MVTMSGNPVVTSHIQRLFEGEQGAMGPALILMPGPQQRMCDRHGAAAKRRREGMDSVMREEKSQSEIPASSSPKSMKIARISSCDTRPSARFTRAWRLRALFRRIARPFVAAIGQHAGAARYNDRAAESVARSAIDRNHAKGG